MLIRLIAHEVATRFTPQFEDALIESEKLDDHCCLELLRGLLGRRYRSPEISERLRHPSEQLCISGKAQPEKTLKMRTRWIIY